MFTPKRMYSCCVCGWQFKFTDLQALASDRVDPKLIARHLSSALCEHLLCRSCKRQCPSCHACIPQIQLRTHTACSVCVAGGAKRRKV